MPSNKKKKSDIVSKVTPQLVPIEPEIVDSDSIDISEYSEIELPIEEQYEASENYSQSDAVTKYDPLNLYLQEVRRIPLLSKEEEKEVALRYWQTKDLDAAKTLIQSNLWLVVKIAREYQSAAKNMLDLIQEGNIGLMEAVKNFDPFRDVRLPSYAMWWIKAYIVRYLIANFRLVKIGTTQAQRKLFFNLKKEKAKLEQQGFFPAPKLLAEKLDVKESDVIEMEQRMSGADISVHTPIGEDSDNDLLSVLPNESYNAEDILAEKETRELLSEHFSKFSKLLNDKELAIFKGRLLSEDKMTLQELSDKFSISKERIRQIEERLLQKLKVFLEERMID